MRVRAVGPCPTVRKLPLAVWGFRPGFLARQARAPRAAARAVGRSRAMSKAPRHASGASSCCRCGAIHRRGPDPALPRGAAKRVCLPERSQRSNTVFEGPKSLGRSPCSKAENGSEDRCARPAGRGVRGPCAIPEGARATNLGLTNEPSQDLQRAGTDTSGCGQVRQRPRRSHRERARRRARLRARAPRARGSSHPEFRASARGR